MAYYKRGCLGEYDFERIARVARRRFVEGWDTMTLLEQASSEREREEVALVCLLNVEDEVIRDIELHCRYAQDCHATDCRALLRALIEEELRTSPHGSDPPRRAVANGSAR